MQTTTIQEETTEAGTTVTQPGTSWQPGTTTSDLGTTSSESSPTHGPGPIGLPKYVVGKVKLMLQNVPIGL